MNGRSSKQFAIIHEFESHYQKSLHQTELLFRDEEDRLSQLHALAIRDDAAALHDELSQRNRQIAILTKLRDKASLELENRKQSSRNKESQLNKQALELANLRAEIELLASATEDSNKIMQEKVALSRDLDRLQPEMENLKSQLTEFQSIIALNHDLQRRIDRLEMDMEKQRSTSQRAHERQMESLTNELKLSRKEAERQAASDKKDRDRTDSEHKRGLLEALSHTEDLEKQVSVLKSKLRNVQSELKATQAELGHCRAKLRNGQPDNQNIEDRKGTKATMVSRNAQILGGRIKNEVTIQSPSKNESMMKPARKRAAEQALVGDKSTFSVTPFLNRTKGLLEDSVQESLPIEGVESTRLTKKGSPSPSAQGSGATEAVPVPGFYLPMSRGSPTKIPSAKPRGRPKTNALVEAPSFEKSRPASMKKNSTVRKPDSLDPVAEDSCQDEQVVVNDPFSIQPDLGKSANGRAIAANGKRKRKMFSACKNIFEEEEDETVQGSSKILMGPTRKLKAPLKDVGKAFATTAEFSPLKRDRRGIHASFLA